MRTGSSQRSRHRSRSCSSAHHISSAFDGVALYAAVASTRRLVSPTLTESARRGLLAATPLVHEDRGPHRREHSLEMQLPFLRRVAPEATIVPLLMGHQTDETARELGEALARVGAAADRPC